MGFYFMRQPRFIAVVLFLPLLLNFSSIFGSYSRGHVPLYKIPSVLREMCKQELKHC